MQADFRQGLCAFAGVASLLLACEAQAHHSFAVFDAGTEIEIRGVVVDFKLRNPHSSLVIDGLVFVDGRRQAAGAERWEIEADAAAPMRTSGIDEQTFQVGDPVVSVSVEAQGSGTQRIAGRWQQPLPDRREGSALPLKAAGLLARSEYDPALSPANTCEPINLPELLHAPFFLVDIEFAQDRAVFRHELYDVVRTIPLNGRPEAVDPGGQFGIAIGQLESDSLVVESKDYRPSLWGLGIATQALGGGGDVPSSNLKSLVERYTVTDDGQTLMIDYRLDDPTYLEASYDGHVELTRVPGGTEMYPYRCDPESAAMWSRSASDEPLKIGPVE